MHTKVKIAGITVEKYDCITHPQQYAEQGVWGDVSPSNTRSRGCGMGDMGMYLPGDNLYKKYNAEQGGMGDVSPRGMYPPNKNLLL